MKNEDYIQLAQLVEMQNPLAVFEEVKFNFINHYPYSEFLEVRAAFKDFLDLLDGRFAGYKGCNTKFHDKIHTTDALLAVSRLMDGYNIMRPKLSVRKVKLALIATIMHDSGYIQKVEDGNGTGAKYTLNHVDRSVDFIDSYLKKKDYSAKDINAAKNIISCTGLSVSIGKIDFSDKSERVMGTMLGTADLLGQMSSRVYLEKLLFLFHEFEEGGVKGYESELDLMNKTIGFYDIMRKRLCSELEDVQKYMIYHFKKRYRVSYNIYEVAITRNINYLKKILAEDPERFRDKLRRRV